MVERSEVRTCSCIICNFMFFTVFLFSSLRTQRTKIRIESPHRRAAAAAPARVADEIQVTVLTTGASHEPPTHHTHAHAHTVSSHRQRHRKDVSRSPVRWTVRLHAREGLWNLHAGRTLDVWERCSLLPPLSPIASRFSPLASRFSPLASLSSTSHTRPLTCDSSPPHGSRLCTQQLPAAALAPARPPHPPAPLHSACGGAGARARPCW